MAKYQTLHSHTTTSDGEFTYAEMLDACEKYGIGVVAFTDHDALPNEKELKFLKDSSGHATKWVMGIEISAGPHIVGLFIDPTNKKMKNYCAKAKQGRISQMQKIVENLVGLGFVITTDDVLEASGGGASIGRPHIVRALQKHEKNIELMQKLRKDLEQAATKEQRAKKLHDELVAAGDRQLPYCLFLRGDAFVRGVYVPKEYCLELDDAVKLIRDAGGLAIFAHYFFSERSVPRPALEKLFAQDGIDGGETIFGLCPEDTDAKYKKAMRESEAFVKGLCEKYGKVESGGADAHYEADLKMFSKDEKYANRTIGLVEKMIEKTGVDTQWSSL